MTPFDGVALVAMLVTFYPVVSPAQLRLARNERPEYFSGGKVIGSKGDKLELPDGRVFDLIFAAGGPPSGMRWQCIEAGPGDGGDPWPLEPGPLTPIDEPAPIGTTGDTTFQQLMGGALEELGFPDVTLAAAAQTVSELTPPAVIDASVDPVLSRAYEDLAGDVATGVQFDLADEIEQAGGLVGAITTTEEDHNEPPESQEYPSDTDPGPPGSYHPRPEPPGREDPGGRE